MISFGVGRTNDERVEHELFDDAEAWKASDREDYRQKAAAQLGTVGSRQPLRRPDARRSRLRLDRRPLRQRAASVIPAPPSTSKPPAAKTA